MDGKWKVFSLITQKLVSCIASKYIEITTQPIPGSHQQEKIIYKIAVEKRSLCNQSSLNKQKEKKGDCAGDFATLTL